MIPKFINRRFTVLRFDLPRILRWVLVLILYLITYSVLDQITLTLQLFPGVVAWYPPDGLSFAFLLTFGAGFTPVVALASLISSTLIYRLSTPLAPLLVWSGILSAVYGLNAYILRRRIRIDPRLSNLRDTSWLILTSAIAALILAVISVTSQTYYGNIPSSEYFHAFAHWWIGETIGVLVFAPFLLIHVMPWLKRFIEGGWANTRTRIVLHKPSLDTIGQAISILVVLYIVFGIPALGSLQPFFLIAAPLIWMAVKNGFSRVSFGIVAMNFGIILAVLLFKFDTSRLADFQFLMYGIYFSALLTGAIVTKQKRTEEELRHREILNRALIDNAPDSIMLFGKDGSLKYLSPSTRQILGLGPDEQVGSNPADFIHPEDLQALVKLLGNLSQLPGGVVTTQFRFRHMDGSWCWLESIITDLLSEPSVQAIVFNIRDISERKQAEEALRKSEKRFRALIEHSLEEISLVNPDGTLIFEGPTTGWPLGYPPNTFVGRNLFDLFHPDDRPGAAQLLAQVVSRPGSVEPALYRLRHQDGTYRWIEGFLSNLLDEPAVEAVVINYHDVTERIRGEEALRQSQEETIHANRLLLALSHAAQAVQRAHTIEEVYTAIQDQVTQMGYSASGFELLEDGRSLRIAYLGYGAEVTRMAEKMLGLSRSNFRFVPRPNSIYAQAIQKGKTIYVKDAAQAVADTIPIQFLALARPLADLFKLGPSLITPLKGDDHIFGLMAFTGPGLTEEDSPAVTAFTSQAAIAIQNAQLYEQAQREIAARKQAEEKIKINNDELSMLFNLSHALAEANNLEGILELVSHHAVESIHTTFARIALFEQDDLVTRGAYPLRIHDHVIKVGDRNPVNTLPYLLQILEQDAPTILLANDPEISQAEKKALLLDFAQSVCLIPLRLNDSSLASEKLLGLLMLGEARNEGREPFTPDKMRLAHTIGDSAAIAIRRILLHEQTERRLQQLTALSEIDLAILSSSDMAFSLGVVLLQVTEQLKVDAADVWLFDPLQQALEFVTGRGFRTQVFGNVKPLHLGDGFIGQAALERRTIYVPDLSVGHDNTLLIQALAEEPFTSYYAVPLIVKGQVKGVLELLHRTPHELNEERLIFLHALANQAAIAIDNASLFKDLQQSNTELTQAYDATILGWSRALDLRDNETEGHTQRVTELTATLGRQFGLFEEDLVHLRRGALLHDIGKMGVPDRILLKPGPLTEEEWIVMRKHADFAYDLLSPICFLQPAMDIPYCHHEKWDGSGYPRGLRGDQIPFAARIFAVIDVWDAITSDRPYRDAWPEDKALEHIKALAGTHFDPQVVKICLESGLLNRVKK